MYRAQIQRRKASLGTVARRLLASPPQGANCSPSGNRGQSVAPKAQAWGSNYRGVYLRAMQTVAAQPAVNRTVDAKRALALAREVLGTEARAITALANRLSTPFVSAVQLILECRGRVVVSGIGKSGHVARKLAATLASTGTPAFFVHSAEAGHGDLRRCLERVRDISATPIAAVMTQSPRTIEATRLAIDCVDLMETPPKVSQLLVVDTENRLVGALHLHDLFRARVV